MQAVVWKITINPTTIPQNVSRSKNANLNRRLITSTRMLHSLRLARKKATVSPMTERVSVIRKMEADANLTVIMTVVGLGNETTIGTILVGMTIFKQ